MQKSATKPFSLSNHTPHTFTPPIKEQGHPDITGLCSHNGNVLVLHDYGATDERFVGEEIKEQILKRLHESNHL